MKKDETLIQTDIMNYLNDRKIIHWRMSGASNLSGFPDLLMCHKGWFIALEVKTPFGQATLQQKKVILDIIEAGGVAGLVTSVADVKDILDGLDKEGFDWWKRVYKP